MVHSRTLLGGALALSSLGAVAADCTDQRVNYTASWEADPQASWHIHSLTLLEEDDAAPARCDRARVHDGEALISALTSTSALGVAGIEGLEGEWKERELGEGLEETLERAWRRSGTCIPTFDPACSSAQLAALYSPSSAVPEGADAVPYFLLAHQIFQSISTLALLDAADITPAEEVTYSLAEVTAALAPAHPSPIIICDGTASLLSISYPLALSWTGGSAPSFSPLALDPAPRSTCPDEGIFYHPSLASRAPINRGKRVASQTWDPIYRPSPRPITLSSSPSATPAAAAAEPAPVEPPAPAPLKAQKLGFFGKAEQKRGQLKEGKHNEGKWGKKDHDEL